MHTHMHPRPTHTRFRPDPHFTITTTLSPDEHPHPRPQIKHAYTHTHTHTHTHIHTNSPLHVMLETALTAHPKATHVPVAPRPTPAYPPGCLGVWRVLLGCVLQDCKLLVA